MSKETKATLAQIGEPDRFEIMPGLVLEDKLRIKTQRRLEKQFGLPISHIFPGKVKNPKTEKVEKWDGIDFVFLNNSIPLLAILAMQVDENITEEYIEDLLDSTENEALLAKNLKMYFDKIKSKGTSKNSQRPDRKKKKKS